MSNEGSVNKATSVAAPPRERSATQKGPGARALCPRPSKACASSSKSLSTWSASQGRAVSAGWREPHRGGSVREGSTRRRAWVARAGAGGRVSSGGC